MHVFNLGSDGWIVFLRKTFLLKRETAPLLSKRENDLKISFRRGMAPVT
jgi:hypothetical protein